MPTAPSTRLRRTATALVLLALTAILVLFSASAALTTTVFSDVPAGSRYAEAIADLASRQVINGYTDGRFGPGDPVLRQQFAKMIVLTGDYPVSEFDICPFLDVTFSGLESFYPDNYVAVAAAHDITVGRTPTSFAPLDRISRFQVVSMVVRAADDLESGLLADPPASYDATWDPSLSPTHGPNARKAEYNGLLAVLPLDQLDPWASMPRGEVAQILHNLLGVLGTPGTTSTTTEGPDDLVAIPKLKGIDWSDFMGDQVTVEGVFVRDPLPMLVTDLAVVRANTPMPVDSYVLLGGAEALALDPEVYGGQRLRVTGEVGTVGPVATGRPAAGPLATGGLLAAGLPLISIVPPDLGLTDISFSIVGMGPICAPDTSDVPIVYNPDPDPHKYAVLFSGGVDMQNNHVRYWNDLKFMYSALVGPLGFPPENVTVLYADGLPRDFTLPVDSSATPADLTGAFADLRATTTDEDLIFVFFTNHGGGFNVNYTGTDTLYGGRLDSNRDEPGEALSESTYQVDLNGDGDAADTVSWDEELCAWQSILGGSSSIYDDELQTMTAGISFDRMVFLTGTCFGGGLIHDLAQGGDRIIMSSAGEHEFSWSRSDLQFCEFSYHFTSAIKGEEPDGSPVDADTNDDGAVSLTEAYDYARSMIESPETPHYEDSGDGIPHTGVMPSQGEGALGSTTWLAR